MEKIAAIDIGASRTRILVRGSNVAYDQPTLVAVDARNGNFVASGDRAIEYFGRNGGKYVVRRPFKEGVCSNPDQIESYLKLTFSQIGISQLTRYRIGMAVPGLLTSLEAEVLSEVSKRLGVREVFLVSSLVAAAISCGMNSSVAEGFMVMILGASTTEAAVLSLGQIVTSHSTQLSGATVDSRIAKLLLDRFDLVTSYDTIEQIKEHLVRLTPMDRMILADVWGRDVKTGESRQVRIEDSEVWRSVKPILHEMTEVAPATISKCGAELVSDLMLSGFYLVGGGSKIEGMAEAVSKAANLVVHQVANPTDMVVSGVLSVVDGSVSPNLRGSVLSIS